MKSHRRSSIRRPLTIFAALAVLILLGILLSLAALDWDQACDIREREIVSGYQYSRALIQERLAAAGLLAQQAAAQPQPAAEGTGQASIALVTADGRVLASPAGRSIPRLAELVSRLPPAPLTGIEVADDGTLAAVGACPLVGRWVVAILPFTPADANAIREATGLDSSFFAGRTRAVTTLRNPAGQPATSELSAAGWDALLAESGHLHRIDDPGLAAGTYLQIQVPLHGLDGALVGAYAISRSWADHQSLLLERAGFWLALIVGGAALMVLLTLWLRWRILGPFHRLRRHLEPGARLAGEPVSCEGAPQEIEPLIDCANQALVAQAALAHNNARLSEQVVQAQTLAALGQLAAGVAHDLNNPLTTIMGLADILLATTTDSETQRDLTVIRRQAERSGRIVRGLLSFARRQQAEPQWVSLNDLVTQTQELLAYQARINNIRCEARLDKDLPLTWGDPSQLQQVLFNLINNAIQAMASARGKGNLLIQTFSSPPTPGAPHGRIGIHVQDDGPGIAEDALPHLFQPYFTTKEPGDGTGLGLAIAASVVRRHSGRIWAENNPRGGASFHVELPVTPEPPQGLGLPTPDAEPVLEQRNILLADSDPQRVIQLARVLRRHGHLVSTAGDGLLARTKMEMERFDLVLCALELARLDGRALYTWARAQHPGLDGRFIFIIPASVSSEAEAWLQTAHAPVLRPPFPEDTIIATVNQVLAGPAAAPTASAQAS